MDDSDAVELGTDPPNAAGPEGAVTSMRGRVAIVTGRGSGIGHASALALAEAGVERELGPIDILVSNAAGSAIIDSWLDA